MALAEARGADVSLEAFELYASALAEFPDKDLRAELMEWASAPVEEFEKPWPRLGDLIEPLRNRRRRRIEAKQATAKREQEINDFWTWAREWMKDTGHDEAELFKRWPGFKGTQPTR